MRRVQLLDVLAQRNVDSTGRGKLCECGIQRRALRGGEKGDRGELGEGARVGGHGLHPVWHRPPRGPARAGPGVEHRVAGLREGRKLGVQDVVCRGGKIPLQEREPGEASRENDMVEPFPFGLAHRLLRFFDQLFLELGLA